ncbi:HpcH/HpaI aldolase/citrate lyase family protein [Streptomyces scopuliridis]|uniref:HpcH/HpaI aldolase family protein n=1 Tax=Streptomyces scopuliridis TaxID=452529 RepID=UPI0036793F11
MKKNTMKEKIRLGEMVFGLGLDAPDPMMVEYAALAGLDFVRFDCEQGPYTLESIEHAARAAEAADIVPTARIPGIKADFVVQLLNRGVSGLTFAHTQTVRDAAAAVRSVKFAPEGDRTLTSPSGHGMHARWALGLDAQEAFAFANRETLVVCTIEDPTGLANIGEIAAVPGVDVLTFGPNDIAATMGYTGDTTHPEVRKAVREGIKQATAAGKAVGISIGSRSAEWAADYVEAGARVLQFLPAPLMIDAVARARADLGV